MRKTKIVCTLGPSTDREGVLREMIQAGMNVARFNFSHGTHAEHKVRLDALKALREELDAPVAAMLDTKGPEVRLKDFAGGRVHLTAGQEFTLTTVQVEGDAHRCSITYGELPGDVKAGDTILLDDGLVRLTVLETSETEIRCRVENDGDMKNHKGVNVPGVRLNMPYMSQQERDDLLFGAEQGFDYVAASFVRSAADVRELRHVLDKAGSRMRIIAKIENQEGVSNLPEIKGLVRVLLHAAGTIEIVHAHLHGGGTVAAVGGLAALLQVLLTAAVGIRQLQQLRRESHHIGLLRLGLVVGILLCHGKSSLRGAG